jgi:hypothetical protein
MRDWASRRPTSRYHWHSSALRTANETWPTLQVPLEEICRVDGFSVGEIVWVWAVASACSCRRNGRSQFLAVEREARKRCLIVHCSLLYLRIGIPSASSRDLRSTEFECR